MWIDKKRQVETEKRKGFSTRTIISLVVLSIGFIISYFFTGWLLSSGIVTMDLFYVDLSIPETISQSVIRFAMVLVTVFVMQTASVIGFAMATPNARKRSGQPTALAQDPDFYESQYDSF